MSACEDQWQATWCAIHGDCTCPRREDGEIEFNEGSGICPLHDPTSDHPIRMTNSGAQLLDQIIAHDDTMGHLANSTGDELRDALRVAADRLRAYDGRRPRGPMYDGARRLVAEVWWLVQDGRIDSRSRAADAALDLRDTIDTDWWPDRDTEPACRRPADG